VSLVERQQQAAQQAATQTAPAAPVTPGTPPPPPPSGQPPVTSPEAKPYKHLVVIAAVLVLIAVVTSAAILLTRSQTGAVPTPAPPPATAVPSASPTLSAKQQAAAEAIDRYTAYVKAVDESAQNGSDAAGVQRLVKAFTVNPQSSYDIRFAKAGRDGEYRSTGYSKVTARVDSISSLSGKVPVAMLTTCTDATGVTIRKAGKPIPRTFEFVKGTITMKRVDGRWMVANTVNPNEPDRKSCTV